jgi:hypothetical protein
MCITVVYYPSMNTHKAYTANNNTGDRRFDRESNRNHEIGTLCILCVLYYIYSVPVQ